MPCHKKFTEPVALSSTQPADLPLPRTAFGRSFNLLALRARCEQEPTHERGRVKMVQQGIAALCDVSPTEALRNVHRRAREECVRVVPRLVTKSVTERPVSVRGL